MTHIIHKTIDEVQTMLTEAINLARNKPTFVNRRTVVILKTLLKEKEITMSPNVTYKVRG